MALPAKPLPSYGEKLVSAIGPGDFVECIANKAPGDWVQIEGRPVVPGGVYQVREVGEYRDAASRLRVPGLRLVGTVAHTPKTESCAERRDAWWRATAFRPIYRPKSELITDLLKSVDEPIREGVDA